MYLHNIFCLQFSTTLQISWYSQQDLRYYFLYSHLVSAQILVSSPCLLCILLPPLQFKLKNRITFSFFKFHQMNLEYWSSKESSMNTYLFHCCLAYYTPLLPRIHFELPLWKLPKARHIQMLIHLSLFLFCLWYSWPLFSLFCEN